MNLKAEKRYSSFLKKIFVFLLLFFLSIAGYGIKTLYAQNKSVISIESARRTEYKKDPVSGDDTIYLDGDVVVSVTQGSSKTTISSRSLTYNRVTDMIFAEGGVKLTQTGGSEGNQTISAESLLFNSSTLEGVFDNGRVIQTQSDAINLPSGSTLVVSSDIFGRGEAGTIAFKNGELTFCDDENPHWKIRASRIWLLPGGEFAFLNAVFYVGKLPMLYLPAFYYPKDELIFNPAFGYSVRTGYYIQTTTYVLGRKPLDTSSDSDSDDLGAGLYNFMKPSSLKEQRREGLVLHNLDEDYSGNTSNYLKIMGDYYSNLGLLVGLDGVWKPSKIITGLEGNIKLGFSNTLFGSSASGYTPYSSSGETYKDKSNFMGLELPFRYGANLKFSMSKPFTLNLTMPVWSDPYFSYDFGERKESMDWIGFLTSSAEDDDDDDATEVSSFTWTLSGSYTLPLPDFIKPFVSTLAISSVSSSIIFSSKSNTALAGKTSDNWASYTPERKFYYPSQVTPFKMSTKIAGTIFEYKNGSVVKSSSSSSSKKTSSVALDLPEEFGGDKKDEKGNYLKAEENNNTDKKDEKENEDEEELLFDMDDFPSLTALSPSLSSSEGLSYSLTYSITPEYTSQFTYDSSLLKEPSDFKWSNLQSTYYQVKSPTVLTSSLSYGSSLASMKNTFTFNPVYQEHPSLDGYTETSAASVTKADYSARKLDLTNTNSVSLKPLQNFNLVKNTSVNWNTTVKMIRTNFLGDADNPEWEYLTMDLTDEDCVTTHTLSSTVSFEETSSTSQVLTLSTTLPPQTEKYTASLALKFPYMTFNFSGGVQKESSDDDAQWKKNPFQQSASLKFFSDKLTFTESFNYDFGDSDTDPHADSFKIAASYGGLQLSYTSQYTYNYDFDSSSGWTIPASSEKEFIPQTLSLAYTSSSSTFYYWKKRISFAPSLSTSIVLDLDRVTNSYFKFIPSITFKINDFLDLTFSSESKNSVIFRYVQNIADTEIEIPGSTNVFQDLFYSFAFWDTSLRQSSGFKLKSLSAKITHKLCDWDLSASFSVSPRLVTENGSKAYDFSPYFTLSVSWKPMESIKTEIVDEYGDWKFE